MINLVPSQDKRLQMDYEPIQPPLVRTPAGRPKKVRKRATNEQPPNPHKVSREGQ